MTLVGTLLLIAAFALLFLSVFPSLCLQLQLTLAEKTAFFALAWLTAFVWYGLFPLVFSGAGFGGGRMGILILEIAVGMGMIYLGFWKEE